MFAQNQTQAETNSSVSRQRWSPKKIWQKWRHLKKRWKFLIIIVILFIVGFVWSKISAQKEYAANRELVTVEREDLKKEAIRSGQVELQGVVEVTPPISGVITELLVENGQQVQEGDLLFKIKSDATQAELDQAWASYLSAKNNYDDAKNNQGVTEWNNFESAKSQMMALEEEIRLFEEQYPEKKNNDNKEYQELKLRESIARRTLTAATLTPSQISSRLQESRAAYQAALSAYNASRDGTYKAPITGRVENLGVNAGENVIAKVGDEDGTPLFLLVPEGKKTISMQIGPSDAMNLQVGKTATVKNDYLQDASFSAQVVRVDQVGKTTSDKGLTYRAWLEVDDPDNQLLLGIPVEITLVLAESPQTLTLPSDAISDNTVNLANEQGDIIEVRPVVTGLKASGKTEIVSGLNEGDFVLIDRNPQP